MKIAAVTMAYNEPDFIPVWIRHYATQFGPENCYLIDHGSDDGSTDTLGRLNVLRIPRSPQDDPRRAAFVSEFCASLLRWYDRVIYSDVDELLVADPLYHDSLAALCAATTHPAVTSVGFDVQHLPTDGERDLDPSRLISHQRHWLLMTTSMCKPLIISKPVTWAPGFHSSDAPIVFAPLLLFHLRHYDQAQALRRMAKTRAMAWRFPTAGSHQKLTDQQVIDGRIHAASHPRKHYSLDINKPPLSYLLAQLLAQQDERLAKGDLYRINVNMIVRELWQVPDRFVGKF